MGSYNTLRDIVAWTVFNDGKARVLHPMLWIIVALALLFWWIFWYYPSRLWRETKETKFKLW